MNAKLLLSLSVVLFAVGIYFYRKTSFSRATRAVVSLAALVSVCLNVAYAVSDYFTANGIDSSVLYHLRYGLTGAGFSEYRGLIVSSLLFVVLALGFLVWTFRANPGKGAARRSYALAALVPTFVSPLVSPGAVDLYELFLAREAPVVPGEIAGYFRNPSIRPAGESRNLVFIYAESLERTYFDERLFPGLIKGLRGLEASGTYFTGIDTASGTSWTISGIVGSLCGMPLVTPSHGNSMAGMDRFLPAAVCMGDLLKQQGYRLAYYGGAELDFAGKGKFFKTHGFEEVKGREELLNALGDRTYVSGWGLHDDSLFDMAYGRFAELSERGQRFGLFMLTLDTHHPYGHPSPRGCAGLVYGDGSNPILNAVACSDRLITEFVDRIRSSPWGRDTVVVVASDHVALRNTATDLLNRGERKNLFVVIDPAGGSKRIDTHGSVMDIGPTVLPFIGYEGDIGLGRDLVAGERPEEETRHVLGRLDSWQRHFSGFWDFPRIRDHVEINFTGAVMDIDGRTFRIPALVEVDENLETTIRFDFYRSGDQKSISELALSLGSDRGFILIDLCANAMRLDPMFGGAGACVVAGRNGKYRNLGPIFLPDSVPPGTDQVIRLTPEDVRYFTGHSQGFEVQKIAHAGGGVKGESYTNSYEALDENLKNGFRYFELDFSFTSDGALACIHDWEESFSQTFGLTPGERPTIEGFKTLAATRSRFRNCTLDGLVEWMQLNPSAKIVTDVKDDNLRALELISKKVPGFKTRVIPQVYDPEDYERVREMGYERIIWTLYRYRGSNAEVLKWADRFEGPFAVTMPKGRAQAGLALELAKRHVPAYVHTINSPEEAGMLMYWLGVADIYTDFIHPG